MAERDPSPEKELIDKVKADSEKKLKMQKEGKDILFGLGTFGVVGWSIAVPVLIGIALGIYLDDTYDPEFSWTLTLLFTGVIIGCINAWLWIKKKSMGE
ncbi:AtpZ/AtpI family protein [uncultured Trichococcus sp.]|uniref:AtpZ/AtpI family protein n=1 Tax=uncultured Trichococcus sp. TaxID=189665 RepID=UPI002A1882A2|nr:AtpZ/AtpI family protein [uncultured Trichococcus sp.]